MLNCILVLHNMERSPPTSSTSSPSCGWSRPAPSPAPPSGWACPNPFCRRRVARLEEQLGARLLTRTARGAQPTDVGQAYYARAAAILADLEAAQEVVAEAVTQIAGPIRLTAPLSFGVAASRPGARRIRRRASQGRARHRVRGPHRRPDRRRLRPRRPDRQPRRFRPGRAPDRAGAQAAGREPRLSRARGRPERPADLAGHDILLYGNEQWRFRVGGRWETIRVAPVLRDQQWRDAARRRRGRARPLHAAELHRRAGDRARHDRGRCCAIFRSRKARSTR